MKRAVHDFGFVSWRKAFGSTRAWTICHDAGQSFSLIAVEPQRNSRPRDTEFGADGIARFAAC